MTARSGMTNLLGRLRPMVDDAGTAVWTDDQLQNILDKNRVDFWDKELNDLAFNTSGGTTVYTTYLIGWGDLEEAASGTAAWRLVAASGTAIGTADYSADYINGFITFVVDQAGSARYLDGRSYDLNGAAAQCWRERAAKVASYYDVNMDNQALSRSQWFDHCMKMSSFYSAQGRMSTAMLVRDDVN
jgi:hypothetical protein